MSLDTFSTTVPRLKRPVIGSASLSVIVAFYLVFLTNRTFWAKAIDYLGAPSFALVLLAIGLFALFSAICI